MVSEAYNFSIVFFMEDMGLFFVRHYNEPDNTTNGNRNKDYYYCEYKLRYFVQLSFFVLQLREYHGAKITGATY